MSSPKETVAVAVAVVPAPGGSIVTVGVKV